MKRDMDLVRKIMLQVESKSDLHPKPVEIDGVDDEMLGRHIELLFDAGFLEGHDAKTMSRSYRHILVTDLSWEGHEFISAISKDNVWKTLKDSLGANEISTLPLKVIKDAAIASLTAYVKTKLGLS